MNEETKQPMSDKEFAFAMEKLLRQKKYGLYKLAVEKRNNWKLEHENTQTQIDLTNVK